MIPYIALLLLIGGVIIGVSVITLDKFGSTMDDNGYYSSDYFMYDGTTTVGSEDNTTVVTVNEFFSLTNGNIANASLIIMNASDLVVGDEKILVVHTDYAPLSQADLEAGQVNITDATALAQNGTNSTVAFGYSYYTPLSDGSKCIRLNGDAGVGVDGLNLSDEYFTVTKGIEGESTIAEQQPTIAIIAVMVIIISIIAGVFVYMRYFG